MISHSAGFISLPVLNLLSVMTAKFKWPYETEVHTSNGASSPKTTQGNSLLSGNIAQNNHIITALLEVTKIKQVLKSSLTWTS